MSVAIPGKHPADPVEDESGPPAPLKINKNKLFFKAMCEWCMKRSRKNRKRRASDVLRKIPLERLVKKAKSFRKKINMTQFPPGWIEILRVDHGVIVKHLPRPWLIENEGKESTTNPNQDVLSKENNNSAGSDISETHGSGSASTLSVTPEVSSEDGSDNDMETSDLEQSDGPNSQIERSDFETSNGQNDDDDISDGGITSSTTLNSDGSGSSVDDPEVLALGQTSDSNSDDVEQQDVTNFNSLTGLHGPTSPWTYEIPVCQWWLRCPRLSRILLTSSLDNPETDTDTVNSDEMNTFSISTCSSQISTIYHGTSSSSDNSPVTSTNPNSSNSSQENSTSSVSISSSDSSQENNASSAGTSFSDSSQENISTGAAISFSDSSSGRSTDSSQNNLEEDEDEEDL